MKESKIARTFRADEIAKGFLEATVGNTPLIRLRNVTKDLPDGVEVWAKAEYTNPGGSVKDRAALAMILAGERSGELTPEKTIIDATSGNTGIAYAMLGAARRYRVTLALPKNASKARKQILRRFGAEIIETDPLEATDGAQRFVRALVAEDPDKYFYPDQYNNEANWKAHYATTANEIWWQTNGRVTHFVAGLGTTGTFTGTTRRLMELNRQLQAISIQPASPLHGLEGLKHMASSIVPPIYDADLPDEILPVSTEDGWDMSDRVAAEEGLPIGHSTGANIFAAVKLAERLHKQQGGGCVVTIACDRSDRYFSPIKWEKRYIW